MHVLLTPVGLDRGFWATAGLADIGVAFEYPGHGTRKPRRPWPTLEELADEVVAEAGDSVDLIGVSLGGMVAMHAALRHPAQVRSLLLANTTSRVDPELMLARAKNALVQPWNDIVDDTVHRWFPPETVAAEPPGVIYVRETLAHLDRHTWAAAWNAMSAHDVLERLPEISVPTTCVGGRGDRSAPVEGLRLIADGVKNGRLRILDTWHLPPLERPDDFADMVREHADWIGA